jgi:hypothetical protein
VTTRLVELIPASVTKVNCPNLWFVRPNLWFVRPNLWFVRGTLRTSCVGAESFRPTAA